MDGVSPSKRRGRPSLEEGQRAESLPVRLPKSMYDAVCKAAVDRGVSVSRIVRDALRNSATNTTSP
jgi:hypothetical protein